MNCRPAQPKDADYDGNCDVVCAGDGGDKMKGVADADDNDADAIMSMMEMMLTKTLTEMLMTMDITMTTTIIRMQQ